MKFCFHGDLEEFEALVIDMQLLAWVYELPNGIYQVRCCDESNVFWSNLSKQIWFEGELAACQRLQESFMQYLTVEHFPRFTYRS